MAQFRVTAVREWHFDFEVSAPNGIDAATKAGHMIRSGQVPPVEQVTSEIDCKKISS